MKNLIKTDASICPSCHMGKEFNMCSNGFHVVTTPHPSSDVEEAFAEFKEKLREVESLFPGVAHFGLITFADKIKQASFQSGGVWKTLKECKDEVARKYKFNNWDDLSSKWLLNSEPYHDEAAELYAQSHQVKEGEGWRNAWLWKPHGDVYWSFTYECPNDKFRENYEVVEIKLPHQLLNRR